MASLTEHVLEAPAAATVFSTEAGLGTVPVGDIRDALRAIANATALEDLKAAWYATQDTRAWAVDLCQRSETALGARRLDDDAVREWFDTRSWPAGTWLITMLRERHPSPAGDALTTLLLLMQRESFRMLRRAIPDGQWDLLVHPAVIPPPLQPLLAS
ncbi:hypothetical protein [Streptomyces sp. 7N604]|uniref:hypothetical protein n=1 Tax=Streptomyces sp. 7N604 TaxID=3457415 RepID=UPI003FD352C0